MKKIKIVIITGPTATGKSALAVRLARDFNGSIVNADSVQLYKYLNIAAAKPTKKEMTGIPHYLIDVLDPREPFSAADFRKAAVEKISEITSNNKRAFIVGGSGLYIRILTGGMISAPGRVENIRARLKARAKKEGTKALHDELKTVDEVSALSIDNNDLYRIIRALEVYEATGVPVSEYRKKHSFKENEFITLKIGLNMERANLYRKIEERVDKMIAGGLEEEVRGLVKMGYTKDLKSLSSIGYKQMMMYLGGTIDHEEAVRLIKRDTKRYAKRQLTWLKKESGVLWFDAEKAATPDGYATIKSEAANFFDAQYDR